MIKPLLSLAAAALTALVLPTAAEAAEARITGNVNLRTGPGTQHYAIMVLPVGARVEVYGCLAGYTWCDIAWGNNRGWVSSRYLSTFYAGPQYRPMPARPVPSITFNFGYWDNHYVGRPWYHHRPRPDVRPGPGWGRPGPDWGRPGPGWGGPGPGSWPHCRPGTLGCRP